MIDEWMYSITGLTSAPIWILIPLVVLVIASLFADIKQDRRLKQQGVTLDGPAGCLDNFLGWLIFIGFAVAILGLFGIFK